MRTLVVYDSVFGNTERIARLITTQLEADGPVWLVAAADAGKLDIEGIDLLVVGGGFTPLPFGIFAGVAGLLTRSPWQAHTAASLWRALARFWPWSFLVAVLWYVGLFAFPAFFQGLTTLLGASGLVLVLLALLTGFAHDRCGQVASVPSV